MGELDAEIATLLSQTALPDRESLAMSGASGADAATAAEKATFDAHPAIAARAFSTLTGHMKEAPFPFAVALAALAVDRKAAYPAFDATVESRSVAFPIRVQRDRLSPIRGHGAGKSRLS